MAEIFLGEFGSSASIKQFEDSRQMFAPVVVCVGGVFLFCASSMISFELSHGNRP